MRTRRTFFCWHVALIMAFCFSHAVNSQTQSAIDIVNARMSAYNDHDIEGFMKLYAEDIQVFNFPNIPIGKQGKAHIRSIFQPMFAEGKVRVVIHHQIEQGRFATNHETVFYGKDDTKYVSIYEVKNGLIASVHFVRE